jgi:hypothetical protein
MSGRRPRTSRTAGGQRLLGPRAFGLADVPAGPARGRPAMAPAAKTAPTANVAESRARTDAVSIHAARLAAATGPISLATREARSSTPSVRPAPPDISLSARSHNVEDPIAAPTESRTPRVKAKATMSKPEPARPMVSRAPIHQATGRAAAAKLCPASQAGNRARSCHVAGRRVDHQGASIAGRLLAARAKASTRGSSVMARANSGSATTLAWSPALLTARATSKDAVRHGRPRPGWRPADQ